jgi:hypothetical protein
MAKSLRSKREKRLRTLRREIAEPFYDKKEAAKLTAQAAALAAPPLQVRGPPPSQDAGSSRGASSASAMGERYKTFMFQQPPRIASGSFRWNRNFSTRFVC